MLLSLIKVNMTASEFVHSDDVTKYQSEGKCIVCIKSKNTICFHEGHWYFYENNKITDKEVR